MLVELQASDELAKFLNSRVVKIKRVRCAGCQHGLFSHHERRSTKQIYCDANGKGKNKCLCTTYEAEEW